MTNETIIEHGENHFTAVNFTGWVVLYKTLEGRTVRGKRITKRFESNADTYFGALRELINYERSWHCSVFEIVDARRRYVSEEFFV